MIQNSLVRSAYEGRLLAPRLRNLGLTAMVLLTFLAPLAQAQVQVLPWVRAAHSIAFGTQLDGVSLAIILGLQPIAHADLSPAEIDHLNRVIAQGAAQASHRAIVQSKDAAALSIAFNDFSQLVGVVGDGDGVEAVGQAYEALAVAWQAFVPVLVKSKSGEIVISGQDQHFVLEQAAAYLSRCLNLDQHVSDCNPKCGEGLRRFNDHVARSTTWDLENARYVFNDGKLTKIIMHFKVNNPNLSVDKAMLTITFRDKDLSYRGVHYFKDAEVNTWSRLSYDGDKCPDFEILKNFMSTYRFW